MIINDQNLILVCVIYLALNTLENIIINIDRNSTASVLNIKAPRYNTLG